MQGRGWSSWNSRLSQSEDEGLQRSSGQMLPVGHVGSAFPGGEPGQAERVARAGCGCNTFRVQMPRPDYGGHSPEHSLGPQRFKAVPKRSRLAGVSPQSMASSALL